MSNKLPSVAEPYEILLSPKIQDIYWAGTRSQNSPEIVDGPGDHHYWLRTVCESQPLPLLPRKVLFHLEPYNSFETIRRGRKKPQHTETASAIMNLASHVAYSYSRDDSKMRELADAWWRARTCAGIAGRWPRWLRDDVDGARRWWLRVMRRWSRKVSARRWICRYPAARPLIVWPDIGALLDCPQWQAGRPVWVPYSSKFGPGRWYPPQEVPPQFLALAYRLNGAAALLEAGPPHPESIRRTLKAELAAQLLAGAE